MEYFKPKDNSKVLNENEKGEKMQIKKFSWIIILVLIFACVSELNAQSKFDGIYGTSLPWESPGDYLFDDTSSLYWNMHFRSGRGIAGVNIGEYWKFESQDDTYNKEAHGGQVIDYFNGAFIGGVFYENFMLKIEGGAMKHFVKPAGESGYRSYNLGMCFKAELHSGFSLSKKFTTTVSINFRAWNVNIDDHPYATTSNAVIESSGFLLRTEVYLYYEAINNSNKLSLNPFCGVGYHFYKAKEEDLNTEYHPRGIYDVDVILGVNFIFSESFELEAKFYVLGINTISLSFTYLG